jgi:hypothetical protein
MIYAFIYTRIYGTTCRDALGWVSMRRGLYLLGILPSILNTGCTTAGCPASILYLPATHLTHTSPGWPVKPALQTQSLRSSLFARESQLEVQFRHSDSPATSEYVPAAQSSHDAMPALAWSVPAGHGVHDSDPLKSSRQPVLSLRHSQHALYKRRTYAKDSSTIETYIRAPAPAPRGRVQCGRVAARRPSASCG